MEKVGTKYSTSSLTGQDGHGKGWYEIQHIQSHWPGWSWKRLVRNIAHPVTLAMVVMEKVGTKYSTSSHTGQDGHGKGWYEI